MILELTLGIYFGGVLLIGTILAIIEVEARVKANLSAGKPWYTW